MGHRRSARDGTPDRRHGRYPSSIDDDDVWVALLEEMTETFKKMGRGRSGACLRLVPLGALPLSSPSSTS